MGAKDLLAYHAGDRVGGLVTGYFKRAGLVASHFVNSMAPLMIKGPIAAAIDKSMMVLVVSTQ
jgi:hypothetical protein